MKTASWINQSGVLNPAILSARQGQNREAAVCENVVGRAPLFVLVAAIALAYIAAANMGFALTFENHVSSAIWAPSGIAVSAFILWGGRIWPGVFLGATVAHLHRYGVSVMPVTIAISIGNTLGPALSAKLLRALGFNSSFQNPRDVIVFAFCGAGAPMMITATNGIASLVIGGVIPLSAALPAWWTWWVGDTVGALVVAPFFLTWFTNPHMRCKALRLLEVAAAFLILMLVASTYMSSGTMRLYVFFPLVLWVALRFSQRESTTAVLLVAVIAAWGAIHGSVPMASVSLNDRLTTLDLFIAIFAITTLTGAAVAAKRRVVEAGLLRASADLLRESESRFRGAFESAAIGMAIVSAEGRWSRVNAALCRMLGYSEADLLATDFQSITHPDDLDHDLSNVEALLKGWITDYQMEKRYFHKNGDIVWTLLGVSLVRSADGTPLHFVSQIQDITLRRQMEEKLRASQKMDAVGQLTAGIAHDFNNLLAVVLLNLELISSDVGADSFCGIRAKVARSACDRGAKLTRQLLAFARKQALSPQSHDLTALLKSTVHLLLHALPDSIVVEMPPRSSSTIRANIDQNQFENAVLNIGLNARDAVPGGGVLRLSIATRDVGDDDDTLVSGRYTEIVVRDTGAGKPPHVLARVFEPFFSTKPFAQGSGLGLSMAYGFVRQSGGDIRISSAEGQGTAVTILLPISEAPSVTEEIIQPARWSSHLPRKRILLVEDIAEVRETIQVQLGTLGFEVTTTANGAEGMAVIASNQIDVLITDLSMPGAIDGDRLAYLAAEKIPELRIITMTGYNEGGARAAAVTKTSERRRHLQKPFSLAQMKEALSAVLSESDARGVNES